MTELCIREGWFAPTGENWFRVVSSDNFFNALDSMNITICLKIRVRALIMQNKIVVQESFGCHAVTSSVACL